MDAACPLPRDTPCLGAIYVALQCRHQVLFKEALHETKVVQSAKLNKAPGLDLALTFSDVLTQHVQFACL